VTAPADNRVPVPEWAWSPIARLTTYIEQERGLIDLSVAAIGAMPGVARTVQSEGNPLASLVGLEDLARLADDEVNDDFRRLRAHSLAGLWGAAEAMVDDLVIACLVNEPGRLERPEFSKVRIPLGRFMTLETRQEQVEDLLVLLSTGLPNQGVNRFESRLELVSLSGAYNGKVADAIYELQQLRNVFVHRGGIADRKLVRSCPQLKLSVDQPVRVSAEMFEMYLDALTHYALRVANRIREKFGVEAVPLPPMPRWATN
jgi:hypothetical protein